MGKWKGDRYRMTRYVYHGCLAGKKSRDYKSCYHHVRSYPKKISIHPVLHLYIYICIYSPLASPSKCPRQYRVRLQRPPNPSSPKKVLRNCTATFSRSPSSSPPLSLSLPPLLRNLSTRPNTTFIAVHTNQKVVLAQVLVLQRQKRRKKDYRKDGRCLW